MKKIVSILAIAYLLQDCNPKVNTTSSNTKDNIASTNQKAIIDTTPRVVGIGGIFFFSDSPSKTREWYSKNLGLETTDYGATFETRNSNRPNEINYLQWSPFKTGNKYFAPSTKDYMINYRVQNIEGLIRKLKKEGVQIVDTIEKVEYGKFIHIMDADGNKIELWEPVDSELTKLGGKTNK